MRIKSILILSILISLVFITIAGAYEIKEYNASLFSSDNLNYIYVEDDLTIWKFIQNAQSNGAVIVYDSSSGEKIKNISINLGYLLNAEVYDSDNYPSNKYNVFIGDYNSNLVKSVINAPAIAYPGFIATDFNGNHILVISGKNERALINMTLFVFYFHEYKNEFSNNFVQLIGGKLVPYKKDICTVGKKVKNYCLNQSILLEGICKKNKRVYISYRLADCPDGCVNGRCTGTTTGMTILGRIIDAFRYTGNAIRDWFS